MRRWVWCLVLVGCATFASAQVTLKYTVVTTATPLTTQLNSLANNAYSAAGPLQNNLTGGGSGNGALQCEFEMHAIFAAIPTVGTAFQAWLLRCLDGSNCETAWNTTGTIGPGRGPDLTFTVSKGQVDTRIVEEIKCPPGLYRVQVLNDGTGQPLAPSGSTLVVRYITITGE